MKIALVLDGKVCGIFEHDSPPDYLNDPRYLVVPPDYEDVVALGCTVDGDTWEEPPAAQPIAESFGRIITVLALRMRLRSDERIAIKFASQAGTAAAAAVAVAVEDLMSSEYVWLDFPPTVEGIENLEAYELISSGRASEVLGPDAYSTELLTATRIEFGLPPVPTPDEYAQNGGRGWATPAEAGLFI